MAFTVEPAVRPAPRGRRPRGLGGTRRAASSGRACSPARSGTPSSARSSRSREELAAESFDFAPGDEDVHTAIERRVTELAGDTGARLHTGPQPQRPGRDGASAVHVRRARGGSPARPRAPAHAAAPRPRGRRRLPARLHPPAAGPAGPARAPSRSRTAGRSPATSTASSTSIDRVNVSPLGAGALGGSSLPLDPDGRGGGARLRRPFRELPRRGERPGLRRRGAVRPGAARRAPLPPRRGGRALLERGVRLLPARRRLGDRQLDAAAEEEPRRRRARPGQGRPAHRAPGGLPRHAEGPAARLQPRPARGQGAALRRARPGLARRSSPWRASSRPSSSTSTRCSAPRTAAGLAAIDLAEWLVRRGTPFREAHGIVGALVRESLERGVPLARARRGPPRARRRRRSGCSTRRRRSGSGRRRAAPAPTPSPRQLERLDQRIASDAARLEDLAR